MAADTSKRLQNLNVRGMRIQVAEWGDPSAPPVVLIHGLLVNHQEFAYIAPILARQFRVIAPDLPGFGGSEKPSPKSYAYTRAAFAETIADVMSALSIPRAHVIGHSMGGGVAITLAADRPEVVDRLTLIDAASFPFPLPLKGRLPLLPGVGPFLFKKLYTRAVFIDYFKNNVWNGNPKMAMDDVLAFYRDFDPPDARDAAYAAYCATVDTADLQPRIARVRAPTLVVWGDSDRIFPVSLGHRLARAIQGARLQVVSDCAHAPAEQYPEITAEMVLSHLRA